MAGYYAALPVALCNELADGIDCAATAIAQVAAATVAQHPGEESHAQVIVQKRCAGNCRQGLKRLLNVRAAPAP